MRRATAITALAVSSLLLVGCGDDQGAGTPDVTRLLTADQLPVLVAAKDIPRGTEATVADEEGMVGESTVTRAQYPDDALVDISLVTGQITRLPITEGTVLTYAHFSESLD